MKILHVTNYFRDTHDHVGGAEQACYRTARLLADHGHESVVVTTRYGHPQAADRHAPIRLDAVPVLEDRLPRPVGRALEVLKWYALQYDPLAARAFRHILHRERPDVVHFHNFQFLTFSLLRAASHLPTCVSIYDYWLFCPKSMLLAPDRSLCHRAHGAHCTQCLPRVGVLAQKVLLALRRPIFDRAFDHVSRFIVLSEHSAGVLTGYGIAPERIGVVPLTLPLEYRDAPASAAPQLAEDAVLFVGWLNDRKGVHIAIEAMPHILAARPGAKLYVIGGRAKFAGEYEAAFDRFIRDHDLGRSVEFLGHQPPETVKEYVKAAKVLLLPEQYENMSPLVMVEAMLLGTPVVASDLGGIPEYIISGRSGFLAPASAPEVFAHHAVTLLEDAPLRRNIADRARQDILARNNDAAVWQQTLALYEGLTPRFPGGN